MARKLTIYLETRRESDGFPFTRVRTYNRILAGIYSLDSGGSKGFQYCIQYQSGLWDNNEFETEQEAVNHIARQFDLDNFKLNLREYWNSEWGAIKRTA